MIHNSILIAALCLLVSANAAAMARFKRFYVQLFASVVLLTMFRAVGDGQVWVTGAAAAVWVIISSFPGLRASAQPATHLPDGGACSSPPPEPNQSNPDDPNP